MAKAKLENSEQQVAASPSVVKNSVVKIAVKSLSGKDAGSVDGAGWVFAAEIIPHLVHATVVWQRSKARSGTHQALTRTLKEGGKKKPYKQKHTGRARAGSSVSPLWVGGASIHGPLPRSYETRLPKRTRKQALASVLTERLQNNAIMVVDFSEFSGASAKTSGSELKTKVVAASFKSLGLIGKKVLVVCQPSEQSFARAAKNIGNVSILAAEGLNVYDLLAHDMLVCSKATIESINAGGMGESVN